MSVKRALVLAAVLALAIAANACRRIVDLSPRDAAINGDSTASLDAGIDFDAFTPFDAVADFDAGAAHD